MRARPIPALQRKNREGMSHRLAPKGPDPRRAGQERGPGTEMSGGKRAAVLQRKLEGKDRGGGGGDSTGGQEEGG